MVTGAGRTGHHRQAFGELTKQSGSTGLLMSTGLLGSTGYSG